MFDKNFYPTPLDIAFKMSAGLEPKHKVLEPSAGKGDLAEVIAKAKASSYGFRDNEAQRNVMCIELHPELQSILREKKFRVIHDDFLTFKSNNIYDYIIMNPPFDNGAKHFLKAVDIANGAEIRCLLNAETIKNPYTLERQLLLKYLEDNESSVEYLGNVFKNAERSTNVDVVLITYKSKSRDERFEFNSKGNEKQFTVDDINNGQLARYDILSNMEDRFNLTLSAFTRLIKARNEIKYFSQGLGSDVEKLLKECYDSDDRIYYNNMVDRFRKDCWQMVFSKTKISHIITSKVQEDFQAHQDEYGFMPFTAENIENLFDQLFQNKDEIMTNCIIEAFDLMTKYHKENRVHIEGWKTNDAWKVNKKVILPNFIDVWYRDGKTVHLDWHAYRKLADIEKALCFIAGKKHEDILNIQQSADHNLGWGEPGDSEFFTFRCYKKGTIHLIFKDEFIYQQFNIIACKGKNWLPGK